MRLRLVFSPIMVLCFLLALAITPYYAQDIPSLPHAFYGAVEINGQPAPIGTTIEARAQGAIIDGAGNSIVTAEAGKYGTQSPLGVKLVVQSDLLKNGDIVEFYINGIKADQTYPFASGEVTELKLTVAIVGFTLNTSSNPAGSGMVNLNPVQPAAGYSAGTVVTLTATANAGYIFTGWSGDLTGSTNPTTITMDSNKNVTANFKVVQYPLTVTGSPDAGGTVNLNPVQSSAGYDAGVVVTLTANANAGYIFTGWSGDLTGDTNPATITMKSSKNITANFTATIAQGILSLPHAFYGTVEINSQPASIGTTIEARAPGVIIGGEGNPIVTIEVGLYGTQSPLGVKLVVQSDLLKNGDIIEFYINGLKADQTYPFTSGEVTERNLTVATSG